jgi:hypothetical protein
MAIAYFIASVVMIIAGVVFMRRTNVLFQAVAIPATTLAALQQQQVDDSPPPPPQRAEAYRALQPNEIEIELPSLQQQPTNDDMSVAMGYETSSDDQQQQQSASSPIGHVPRSTRRWNPPPINNNLHVPRRPGIDQSTRNVIERAYRRQEERPEHRGMTRAQMEDRLVVTTARTPESKQRERMQKVLANAERRMAENQAMVVNGA